MKSSAAALLATWFGCGYVPFAPGTAGSLAALAIGVVLHEFAGFSWWHFALLAAIGTAPAIWSATITARTVKLKDPRIVVIDEVLGQWIALAGAHPFNWKSYVAAFVLFRLFDIWKPWPIRQVERRCGGGFGIMIDDVLAAIYAILVVMIGRLILER